MPKSRGPVSVPTATPPVRWLVWGVALALIVLSTIARVRLLDLPLERDEGEYAYAGQLILQGMPPYLHVYNMKLPGIYAAYALILAVFGQTHVGVHLGLLLVNLANTILVYLLGRRLFDSRAGLLACAAYTLLAMSPTVLGSAAHATHFVLLPALGGVLLLHQALASGRWALVFPSGLAFGLAFLMKQPAAAFAAFAAAAFLRARLRERPHDWVATVSRGALLALGIALPFVLTLAVLYLAGVFEKFWFWTFTYAREYALQVRLAEGFAALRTNLPQVIGPYAGIWALAAVGLGALWSQRERRRDAEFVTGFLLFSALAVCPGLYFREHYFILVLPAVALLAGIAVAWATELAWKRRLAAAAYLPVLVFAMASAYGILEHRDFFFRMTRQQQCRTIYGPNPFPESLEIARYILDHTAPGAPLAILGSEPQIYFYARRPSATGHIYTYGLMETHPYALEMQEEMISEIEAARPEFLILVNIASSWLVRPTSEKRIWNWFQDYARKSFEVVGVVDIVSADRTEYRWGSEAREYSPRSRTYLLVLKRKGSVEARS